MHVYKFFIDYDKEEKWLKEMANKGYELTNINLGYRFKKISPEEINYRIDYRLFKNQGDFVDYCTLFEDSGWEHIYGSKSTGNQYFKKISIDGDEDIFSDNISRASRYKRLSELCSTFFLSSFVVLLGCFLSGALNFGSFFSPKDFYYTPGLWEKSGVNFLFSFLFETPFALCRGYIWLIPLICLFMYCFLLYKSNRLYKETVR